ncbi:hypothetical protein Tco_1467706 [Tanacetum coccineum]
MCIILGPRHEVEESSSAPTARPTGGFRADYGFVGTLDAEIRRDPEREIGYGITVIWEDPDEIVEEIPTTDVAELGQRMTDFVTTVRQDTDEIYGRLDDALPGCLSGIRHLFHSLSSPLPLPSPPLPASPTHPLGYRAAMIRLRAESSSTSHQLPLPLPIILPHTRASMAMMRAAAPSTYILASRSETSPLGTPPLLPIPFTYIITTFASTLY